MAKPLAGLSDALHYWSFRRRCSHGRLEAFPVSAAMRTLDALHLASCDYLRRQGQTLSLASYDRRMTTAARSLGIPVFGLENS